MRGASAALAVGLIASACATPATGLAPSVGPSSTPTPAVTFSGPAATATASLSPVERAALAKREVTAGIDAVSIDRMRAHLNALAGVGSRDPRHPGHAQAVAYIREQLGALGYVDQRLPSYQGLALGDQRLVYQGILLTNIFAVLEPTAPVTADGWIMICAHYDSIAARTPGWRPALDPAPGADDNATGTAALLEFARVLAIERNAGRLRQRVTLAFFDGEELFFKGSAAYVQSLPSLSLYAAVLNIDMVGFNPSADRLDLIWYGPASDGLRDRVKAANARYGIGVAPLVEVFANDPARYILDSAPFGLAGIPAITLTQRYGEPDATYPGNTTFHTVNDTPDRITNERLWLKAARLTLAAALELARAD